MALNNAQLVRLKTELDDDPNELGYAGTSHPAAAALLNAVAVANQIPNTSVAVKAARDEIRLAEWEALTQGDRDMIMLLFGSETTIDITNTRLVTQILGVFTLDDSPLTYAAMLLLATRNGSRAEALFGIGISVSSADIMEARQLP